MSGLYFYLRKRPNRFGLYPLMMKFSKDRKQVSLTVKGVTLPFDEWDETKQRIKKSHKNSVRLNNLLTQKIAEASDKIVEAETINEDVSAKVLKEKVKRTKGGSFFVYADAYLKKKKELGDFNVYTADKPRIKHFREFLKGEDITFQEITEPLLNSFKHYLSIRHKLPSKKTIIIKKATALKPAVRAPKIEKPYAERSIINHFVAIRSVFSMAVNEKVLDKKYWPFGDEKFTITFPESEKRGFTVEDVKKIENLVLTNPKHNHARNIFLISFYFGGMRAGDVFKLKWSFFYDLRLNYKMNKNGKMGSMKAPEKALRILQQYEADKQSDDDFIFPELKKIVDLTDKFTVLRRISDCTSSIDKFLKKYIAPAAEIYIPFSMHIARHTFGNISGNTIHPKTLQKIFRHSNIATTIAYMANFTTQDTDDALDKVTNF